MKKWNFFQTEIIGLQNARMQDFAPNTPELLGPWATPRPPAVRAPRLASRTPLHSFLPTGMIEVAS